LGLYYNISYIGELANRISGILTAPASAAVQCHPEHHTSKKLKALIPHRLFTFRLFEFDCNKYPLRYIHYTALLDQSHKRLVLLL
jgi:hypothetical protein